MKLKHRLTIIITTISLGLATNTYAADLMEVFKQSVHSDPQFQAAEAERLSQHQNVPISRSFLLPSLIASADSLYNRQNNKTTVGAGAGVGGVGATNIGQGVFRYNSNGYTLNLSQPLFDYGAWSQLKEAEASVKAADAQYAADVQDLISRVISAYLNVLLTEDNLAFTEAEKRAVYRQLDQVRQQYKVGLVAITGLYQAQAQYDSIVAEEIAAKNDIINAKEDLRAITGIYYNNLSGLAKQVPLINPVPLNVDRWVLTSEKQNWSIQAARFNSLALRKQIQVEFSGHLPILDAVAQYDRQKTGASPSGNVNLRTGSVGVQLTVPILEGGFVSASTKQAEYNYEKAVDQLEQARRTAVTDARQSYNNVMAGISKVKADKQAIVSNQSSLRSTIEAYKVGTQTMLDVLQAQQDLYDAQRIHASDQYAYINATVALKQAAGTLSVTDVERINQWLTSRPNNKYRKLNSESLKPAGPPRYDPKTDEYYSSDASEVTKPTPKKIVKKQVKQPVETVKQSVDTTAQPQPEIVLPQPLQDVPVQKTASNLPAPWQNDQFTPGLMG